MPTRLFLYWFFTVFLSLFSSFAFSHAGSHENKNCFIALENQTVRLSGYQFQGLHPDEAFCRVFPYLGSLIIKIEPVNEALTHQKIALELLKPNSWLNSMSINDSNSVLLKKTLLKKADEGVNMIQANIQKPGLYVLNIHLQTADNKIVSHSFLFLAGIAVTKILVLFSAGLLVLLLLIFITQRKQVKISSTAQN